jgi:phosphoribosylamine--glycine ligase
MKVLVIGSGGREHAMAWKLAQSEMVDQVYAAPGNGGIAAESKCTNVPISPGNSGLEEGPEALIGVVKKEGIRLTVVGPEAPLAEGLVDRFRAAGLAVVGPDRRAARLEASKIFSKSFMETYGVRSARSRSFTDYAAALRYAADHAGCGVPLVIKADGLAAGKGVVVAGDVAEAEAALTSFMKDRSLGSAGSSVILEDFLPGKEVSVLAAVSVVPGKKGTIRPFLSARDHKRRFEGGRGPNTGGMGAIAPVPDFSAAAQEDFRIAILEPTLRGMEQEGMDYRGFIFFGLMVEEDRCFLLEYNVRLGDPETQAVLPLMDADFAGLCLSLLEGDLETFPLGWKAGAVCAPVAVAGGYPGPYGKGELVTVDRERLAETGGLLVVAGAEARFPGGAAGPGGPALYTSGGRVLAVSAWGADEAEARDRAYRGMEAVSFPGMAYRKDIGRE